MAIRVNTYIFIILDWLQNNNAVLSTLSMLIILQGENYTTRWELVLHRRRLKRMCNLTEILQPLMTKPRFIPGRMTSLSSLLIYLMLSSPIQIFLEIYFSLTTEFIDSRWVPWIWLGYLVSFFCPLSPQAWKTIILSFFSYVKKEK